MIVAVLSLATAVVTSWDKLFPSGANASKLSSPTMYMNWRWQAYTLPPKMTADYIKKWNGDCAAEGQRQLLLHGFSIYGFSEIGVGGGAMFPNSQELLIQIACQAMDQHLAYSIVAVGPSTDIATVDRHMNAILEGMIRPGMSFGQ
ncbi:hypothetical protein XH93_25065 [Bradyrhizobium sp. CCBAU 51753]|nr:hypothetical protein XH93_25065 [Bradyrhizobium sp. CCBAU 51753]